jgi:ribonuclease D
MTEPQTWTLVTSEDDLQAMMQALRAQSAIAVDTESNSLYAYRERVCLIQISVPGADYIVDPLAGWTSPRWVKCSPTPASRKSSTRRSRTSPA